MELKEALEMAASQSWHAAEEELAYLRGLADATPDEVESDGPQAVPSTSGTEAVLRFWRGKVIRHHEQLRSLGYNAVVSGAESVGVTHGLYRKALGDDWTRDTDEVDSYMDHTDIRLPVLVIFEGDLP